MGDIVLISQIKIRSLFYLVGVFFCFFLTLKNMCNKISNKIRVGWSVLSTSLSDTMVTDVCLIRKCPKVGEGNKDFVVNIFIELLYGIDEYASFNIRTYHHFSVLNNFGPVICNRWNCFQIYLKNVNVKFSAHNAFL